MDYCGRTMSRRRAGGTVKVSISLRCEDVAVLRRLAAQSYGGNLSAAFAEAARWLRQRESRRRLIDELGGPTLTRESALAIDAEQAGGPSLRTQESQMNEGSVTGSTFDTGALIALERRRHRPRSAW